MKMNDKVRQIQMIVLLPNGVHQHVIMLLGAMYRRLTDRDLDRGLLPVDSLTTCIQIRLRTQTKVT